MFIKIWSLKKIFTKVYNGKILKYLVENNEKKQKTVVKIFIFKKFTLLKQKPLGKSFLWLQ